MFSSSYFTPKYFNRYFKPSEFIEKIVVAVGSGGKAISHNLRKLKLGKDDQDILEFIMSFVINEGLDKWVH